MDQHFDELKRACKSAAKPTDSDRIKQGESTWFAGRPAPAEEGFIAIAQDESIRTIIREQDVQEVQKEGDLYLVRVSVDANVLVRFERVTKAKPEGCECSSSDSDGDRAPGGSIARQSDGTGPFGVPLGPCRLFVYCINIGGRQLCWWWITCPGKVGKI